MTTQPMAGGGSSLGGAGHQSTNLADILERVLDRGLVIAGDIQVNLLDIELLTLKLRLVIASVDTARQLGIDWWTTDPWLSSAERRAVGHRREPGLPAPGRTAPDTTAPEAIAPAETGDRQYEPVRPSRTEGRP